MMMFNWTGALIGALSGAIGYLIIRLFTKNEKIISVLTFIFVIAMINFSNSVLLPYYYDWKFIDDVKKTHPIIELLAKDSPVDFNAFITKVKNDKQLYPTRNNEFYDTGQFINYEFMKYSLNATNSSLYKWAQTTVIFYKQLLNDDPVLILNLEFPDKFSGNINFNLLEKYSKSYVTNLLTAKMDVIQSAIEQHQPSLTSGELQKADSIIKEIFVVLIKQYGEDSVLKTFQNADNTSLDKKVAASIVISFYEQIMSRGEDDTGLLLKYIFTVAQSNK